ncbi:MAG TPA: MFS transporter [Vicinamibacteria bacterium]|nr:MFS transporter [Vicinamibacteria bacterium]
MGQADGERGRGHGAGLGSIVGSWRLLSVVLLSFSSGLPLGVVWLAIPAWMARVGVDIKVIGLFTLAQAPWSFKLLWSPWMDRFPPPFLGRKRGWVLIGQVGLFVVTLWLAGVSGHPETVWVIGALALAIAFASATQDIAIDAYAVEVLRRDELGFASGARTAFYRAAMLVAGGAAITLAAETSWAVVNFLLALLYLPCMVVTAFAPEPEALPAPPSTLREAVWGPFVGFLAQHRSVEILAFVVLYKLADNLSQSLIGPFLIQTGFGDFDVGIARTTIGQAAMIGGTLLGGILTDRMGLGRALWVFGLLQLFANLGYATVAHVGPNRLLMYGAHGFELGTSGLAQGAFGVLLLRLTQKRFSATQYALLSSLFTLPRILAGPITGVLADAIGWQDFFVLTVFLGIPGLVMLARFVPWGVRDVEFEVLETSSGKPLSRHGIVARAGVGAAVALLAGLGAVGLVGGLSGMRAGRGFAVLPALAAVIRPHRVAEWTTTAGLVVLAGLGGLATAATLAARHGLAPVAAARE